MGTKKAEERRKRRAAVRRNQVLDAAAEVFAEKGFARATTREIADRADVSEGTIYNYFESKGDILLGLTDRLSGMMPLREVLDLSAFSDPADALKALLHFKYTLTREKVKMIRTILSEIMIDSEVAYRYREQFLAPLVNMIEENLQARIAAGQLRPIDTSLLSKFFSVIFAGLSVQFMLGELQDKATWDALSELIVDIMRGGVLVSEASQGGG
jgi:AcrR family transcriptional regulator